MLVTLSGVAQDQYTIVFLNKKENKDTLSQQQLDKIMEGHHATRERLWKEGKLLAAGPFDGGGGIYIMNSTDADEVRSWIAPDPGIQAQRWNVEILPYFPRYGGVCVVGEDYTMTGYHFVRFTPDPMKYNASRYPAIMQRHDDYLKDLQKTGNVVTEASFGVNEGGILVMRGDVDRAVFGSDPGVQEGLIFFDLKKLWIAKGSFCEK